MTSLEQAQVRVEDRLPRKEPDDPAESEERTERYPHLPAGLTVAFAAAVLMREVAGTDGWWESSGGFVLLGLVLAALVASLRIR